MALTPREREIRRLERERRRTIDWPAVRKALRERLALFEVGQRKSITLERDEAIAALLAIDAAERDGRLHVEELKRRVEIEEVYEKTGDSLAALEAGGIPLLRAEEARSRRGLVDSFKMLTSGSGRCVVFGPFDAEGNMLWAAPVVYEAPMDPVPAIRLMAECEQIKPLRMLKKLQRYRGQLGETFKLPDPIRLTRPEGRKRSGKRT